MYRPPSRQSGHPPPELPGSDQQHDPVQKSLPRLELVPPVDRLDLFVHGLGFPGYEAQCYHLHCLRRLCRLSKVTPIERVFFSNMESTTELNRSRYVRSSQYEKYILVALMQFISASVLQIHTLERSCALASACFRGAFLVRSCRASR